MSYKSQSAKLKQKGRKYLHVMNTEYMNVFPLKKNKIMTDYFLY